MTNTRDSLVHDEQITNLRDRFEEVWRTGRPRIADNPRLIAENDRSTLLTELLAVDVKYRREAGESPTAEEYAHDLPEHTATIAAAFARASSDTRKGRVSDTESTRNLSENRVTDLRVG